MTTYIGIDVSKASHTLAPMSRALRLRYKKANRLPTFQIDNSHAGFNQLLEVIHAYGSPDDTSVLLEHTGHYSTNLEWFLRDHGIRIYRIVGRRYDLDKTDKIDSRALATMLYNQEELHIEYVSDRQRIAPLLLPSEAARSLRGLTRHRYELTCEMVRRQNKLTAIIDELFPEMARVYADTNGKSALNIRTAFPTPQAIASATLTELKAQRPYLSRAELVRLQELARSSIGSRDEPRVRSLLIEQRQIINELRLMRAHVEELDTCIDAALADSREARILLSLPGVGSVHAATLLAGIGTIANFESIYKLRSYLGWGLRRSQTGTTYDTSKQSRGGNVALKRTMCLVAFSAIANDLDWQAEYAQLVERICPLDERTLEHRHRMKAIGHICGRLIKVMYVLLRRDYALQQRTPEGEPLPEPELYDPARHRVLGREGGEREQHAVQTPTPDKARPGRDT